MTYDKCPKCNEYDFLDKHKCKPAWYAQVIDHHCDDEWITVHAYDAQGAAENMAQMYDQDDHDLLDGSEITIRVKQTEDGPISRFICFGEAIPHYYATLEKGTQGE